MTEEQTPRVYAFPVEKRGELPPDLRKLEDLTLAIDAPVDQRDTVAMRTRKLLEDCGVKVAQDIVDFGCTGFFAAVLKLPTDDPRVVSGKFELLRALRLNLAGSAVGMPCYVPPDRFCLVHQIIGGLQDSKYGKQQVRHPDVLTSVSRELTEQEQQLVANMNHLRKNVRSRGDLKEVGDILSGRGVEEESEPASDPDEVQAAARAREAILHAEAAAGSVESLHCPEHKGKTTWSCRFCVAVEIVKGDLEPALLLTVEPKDDSEDQFLDVEAKDVEQAIEKYTDEKETDCIELYARVAVWRRKLARD